MVDSASIGNGSKKRQKVAVIDNVYARISQSSSAGRGSLSGWTTCPLCSTTQKKRKRFALGRGLAAHLNAVHGPKKEEQRQHVWDDWAKRVAEITAQAENDVFSTENAQQKVTDDASSSSKKQANVKTGLDRRGQKSLSYRDSLPPLHKAAAEGNLEQLKSLIDQQKKQLTEDDSLLKFSNHRDRNGSTAEHWAAGGGHLDCLKFLVKFRNDATLQLQQQQQQQQKQQQQQQQQSPVTTNKLQIQADDEKSISSQESKKKKIRRRDGKTSLHYAARNGHNHIIGYLLKSTTLQVDDVSGDGTTALHMACYGGHVDSVKKLLTHGANVHAANEWGCTAAHWTAMTLKNNANQQPNREEVRRLCTLLHSLQVDFCSAQVQGHTALHKAAQKKNRIIIEWMIEKKDVGGAGLTKGEKERAGLADCGGNKPSDIWKSVGGDDELFKTLQLHGW